MRGKTLDIKPWSGKLAFFCYGYIGIFKSGEDEGGLHMPWTKNDYPDAMKNLDKDVKDKAIEIANALLREGNDEGKAIPIAIDRAKKAIEE